jgi:hypothetical protein
LGRPRSTYDIDVFVRPEEAELTLRALARHGFTTEKTDPAWLYKGFKEGILVDVIFKSKGDIYLDGEMYARVITAEFHGKHLRLVSPEDLIIIKAAAHGEMSPGHWHDALAILSHAQIDWDYLLSRARRAPRRILSLLLYAQSSDIWVPNRVIEDLYRDLFGNALRRKPVPRGAVAQPPQPYQIERIHDELVRHPGIHELAIEILQLDGKLLLRGEVLSESRKQAVLNLVQQMAPGVAIEDEIRICSSELPGSPEAMLP